MSPSRGSSEARRRQRVGIPIVPVSSDPRSSSCVVAGLYVEGGNGGQTGYEVCSRPSRAARPSSLRTHIHATNEKRPGVRRSPDPHLPRGVSDTPPRRGPAKIAQLAVRGNLASVDLRCPPAHRRRLVVVAHGWCRGLSLRRSGGRTIGLTEGTVTRRTSAPNPPTRRPYFEKERSPFDQPPGERMLSLSVALRAYSLQ